MAPNEQVVTVAAVGDVAGHEPLESAFAHVLETPRSADVRFAQVERLYSERGNNQGQGVAGRVRKQASRRTLPFPPLPVFLREMLELGGEKPYLKKWLERERIGNPGL